MAIKKKVIRKRSYTKKKESEHTFKLKDCPWCGSKGDPIVFKQPWGCRSTCNVCECEGPVPEDIYSLQSAANAWNGLE